MSHKPKPIVEAAAAVESNNPSLLDLTLEAAQRDRPTVTAESQKMIRLIEGVLKFAKCPRMLMSGALLVSCIIQDGIGIPIQSSSPTASRSGPATSKVGACIRRMRTGTLSLLAR